MRSFFVVFVVIMLTRFRASFIHLCGSALMALIALGVVYFVWYPFPLFVAAGVVSIFLVVIAVDVVIGPLLTFLVYKKGKKSLRTDLTVIVVLQLMAFGYGIWTIAIARPVWLVFNADRFDLVQAHELDKRFQMDVRPQFLQPSWFGPQWVASRNPADPKKRNDLVLESAMGGADLPQRPDLYVPIEDEAKNIRAKAHAMDELNRYNLPAAVHAVRNQWPEADAWLPMMAKVQPMAVLLSKRDGKPIAVVDLRPWN